MNTNRDCGCKSFRSCLLCENQFGLKSAVHLEPSLEELNIFDYDFDSKRAVNSRNSDETFSFPGIKIIPEFINVQEEDSLIHELDSFLPWDSSQSGRRKQNFGPKANFKGRKVKLGNFKGFPSITQFIHERFKSIDILEDYFSVEQCSIEYRPETGASIEPHIDDCWIWGERIVQLNILSDSVLTFVINDDPDKFNLPDIKGFPRILDSEGECVLFNPFKTSSNPHAYEKSVEQAHRTDVCVRVPLPRRSLLVMHGDARYEWKHCIRRADIKSRRIVLAFREFTPPFLPGGKHFDNVGSTILDKASCFYNAYES